MLMQKLIMDSVFYTTMHNKKDENWKESRYDSIIISKTKPKLRKPKLYRVLLLNDDYTPMDFVVFILKKFFKKNFEEATRIMLDIHQNGIGECGTYTYEVAEMKVVQVMECARQNEHPLQCVMEWK
ncbi:ATP-dependent Clp protease adapter ClpS [Bartonella sp. B17]